MISKSKEESRKLLVKTKTRWLLKLESLLSKEEIAEA